MSGSAWSSGLLHGVARRGQQAVGAGRSTRSAAARAVSGSPSPMRGGQHAVGVTWPTSPGQHRRQGVEGRLVGRPQAVEHQPEGDRVGARRRRGPSRRARAAAARPRRRCRRTPRRSRVELLDQRVRTPRSAASAATPGPISEPRLDDAAARPPGRRSRRAPAGAGSRSRPAWRRKSRTVVAPPWRTSTSRVWAIRCSASRTAGRETPSTSASRRSLGSDSPGAERAGDDLVEHLVEDVVGHRAAGRRAGAAWPATVGRLAAVVKWSDQYPGRGDRGTPGTAA